MSTDRRIGLLGLIVAFFGIAAFYLWPDKKWIGWSSLGVAIVLILLWGIAEIRHRGRERNGAEETTESGPKLLLAFEPTDYRRSALLVVNHGGGWAHDVRLRVPEDGAVFTSKPIGILRDDQFPALWQVGETNQLLKNDIIMSGARKFPAFVTCGDGNSWYRYRFEPSEDLSGYVLTEKKKLSKRP